MSAKNRPVVVVRPDADPENLHTINFVEDGLTAFGQVWYRGQELTIEKGSPDWEGTMDEYVGKSFLDLDEDEQIDRWGRRMYRLGKWDGAGFDLDDPSLTEEERQVLQAVEEEKKVAENPAAVPAAPRRRGRKPKAVEAPPAL